MSMHNYSIQNLSLFAGAYKLYVQTEHVNIVVKASYKIDKH